jgi:hypothetical protein
VVGLVLLLFAGTRSNFCAQDVQVTPDMFGLGDNGNRRSAEPYEVRVYTAKADGTADRTRGPVWPRADSDDKTQYTLKDNEVAVYHGAIDITSRGPDGKPIAREFTAGVHGIVLASRPGFIAVQLADGNIVQYLHVSEFRLKPGQEVKPDAILGTTGNLGTGGVPLAMPIHLHIQVTNPDGRLVDPDRAILAGRAEKPDRSIKWTKPDWVNAGPTLIDGLKPKVSPDGVVKANAANKRAYYGKKGYEVWGASMKELQRYRPWSVSFDTRAQAQDRLNELRRDHGPGGLLESDPDGPINLYIREVDSSD